MARSATIQHHAVVYLYKNKSDISNKDTHTMTNQTASDTMVTEEITSVCNLIEGCRIMGVLVYGVLVDATCNPTINRVTLVLYVERSVGTVKNEVSMPIFPLFIRHEVAQAMQARGLYEIYANDEAYGVKRWWVRFAAELS